MQGLQAVLVSDRDGVTLVKETSIEAAPSDPLSATFAVASEQASKLKMGRNVSVTSFHKDKIIVHINDLPIIITLLADQEVNVGMLMSFTPEIKRALSPLKASIKDTDQL